MSEKSKQYFALGMVLLVAFGVRLLGIFNDFPFTYFGDEQHFIRRSVSFGSGDLNPHWFHKPALYMYLLFFEYGLYFVLGTVLGWFGSVDDFARHFIADMSPFLFLGRLTTVCFSVGTVYFVYRIGTELRNTRTGLLAALFLTFCLGNFSSSVVVKADVPSTFFAIVSLLYILILYRTGRPRDYVLAGLFAGLGTATKYYPITMLIPMYVAHLLAMWDLNLPWYRKIIDSRIVSGGFACVGGFFLGAPYNFLDPLWLQNKLSFLFTLHKVGAVNPQAGYVGEISGGGWEKIQSILISLKNMGLVVLDHSGMGVLIGLLALMGLFMFARDWDRKGIICLSCIASFAIIASVYNPSYSSARHLNMLYPVLCLGAALVVDQGFCTWFPNNQFSMSQRIVISLVCFLLILPGGFFIARYDYRAFQKDTRLLAKEWVEEHIPKGTKMLVESEGPKLQISKRNLQQFYDLAKQEAGVGAFTTHLERYYRYRVETVREPAFDITEIYHPWWLRSESVGGVQRLVTEKDRDMGNPLKPRGVMSFDFYKNHGFEYVVTQSTAYETYFKEPKGTQFPSMQEFYRDLLTRGELVKEFTPGPWSSGGPTVKIFRINTSLASSQSQSQSS